MGWLNWQNLQLVANDARSVAAAEKQLFAEGIAGNTTKSLSGVKAQIVTVLSEDISVNKRDGETASAISPGAME